MWEEVRDLKGGGDERDEDKLFEHIQHLCIAPLRTIITMSNNANQSTDSKKQVSDSDAASFTSATSTLYDGKGSSTAKKSPKKSTGTKLDDSATSFAKKAGEEGWSSPTATRPSMGC